MVTLGSSIHFGLEFPSARYFIRILFPWHDHGFHEWYTDNFTANIPEMLMHARAIDTRLLFPLLLQPGYKASTVDTHGHGGQLAKRHDL